MRIIVVGLGVQGYKRRSIAGEDFVAAVDPVNPDAQYRSLEDVPLNAYDAVLLCIPDEPKITLIRYCLNHYKHVLVEKPLWVASEQEIIEIQALSHAKERICYVAYNHRFEPHFIRMRNLITSNVLGDIYHCRMFYGNGTARLVRNSPWRDQGTGVLADLGSHLFDLAHFWFGLSDDSFSVVSSRCFENKAPDHVVCKSQTTKPQLEMEMSLLAWKNHFTCDVWAQKGSAHISSLCKWGPSTFTRRTRVLPSGKPDEESITIVQADPTWQLEYDHFKYLCENSVETDLSEDRWLHRTLGQLAGVARIEEIA